MTEVPLTVTLRDSLRKCLLLFPDILSSHASSRKSFWSPHVYKQQAKGRVTIRVINLYFQGAIELLFEMGDRRSMFGMQEIFCG